MAEQSPRFMKALADSLGVTRGELRAMAEQGQLTADVVIKAVREQSDVIAAEYAKIPVTISGAIQNIKTNFMLLVGELDSTNAASQGVVRVLLSIADNLDFIKVIVSDAALGIGNFTDELGIIDSSTIDALKDAIGAAYEAIKEVISAIAELGKVAVDAFNLVTNSIAGINPEAVKAGEGVSFLTRIFQGLSVVLGFFKDGVAATKIGLDLLVGAFYDMGSVFATIKSKLTFGDLSTQFANEAALMQQAAQKAYTDANQQALAFQSEGVKRAQEAVKTEQEKNQDRIKSNQETLAQLKANEEKALADQTVNNEKRKQLEVELAEAKKTNNAAALSAIREQLNELDKSDDEFSKANQKRQSEKLKAAQEYAQGAIEANKGVLSAQEHQHLLEMGYLATQTDAQKKASEVVVKAINAATVALENYGLTASQVAKNAAKALGVDLDVAFNQISKNFDEASKKLNDIAYGFNELKTTGVNASNLIYEAWQRWLQLAKSQAEIDFAKQKLLEFEKQGVFSTKQVELGMQALRLVIQKLPGDLDPVEQAFDRLGIKTREQLERAAQLAMADFNTVLASGKATAEQLERAYERVLQVANASGNETIKANARAQASQAGLIVEIDNTGKAITKTFEEFAFGSNKTVKAVDRLASGFNVAGNAGIRAAQATSEAWDNTATSLSKAADKLDELTRKQGGMTGSDFLKGEKGKNADGTSYDLTSKSDLASQLKSGGYSDADAARIAQNIMIKAFDADKGFIDKNLTLPGGNVANDLINKNMNAGLSANPVIQQLLNDALKRVNGAKSTFSPTVPAPNLPSADLSDQLAKNSSNLPVTPSKTVKHEISLNGVTAEVYTDASNSNQLDSILRELETISKSSFR